MKITVALNLKGAKMDTVLKKSLTVIRVLGFGQGNKLPKPQGEHNNEAIQF